MHPESNTTRIVCGCTRLDESRLLTGPKWYTKRIPKSGPGGSSGLKAGYPIRRGGRWRVT